LQSSNAQIGWRALILTMRGRNGGAVGVLGGTEDSICGRAEKRKNAKGRASLGSGGEAFGVLREGIACRSNEVCQQEKLGGDDYLPLEGE
jgi:hypothetical protein